MTRETAEKFDASFRLFRGYVESAAATLECGHVASGSAWYTGVALLNPNDAEITAHLELRDHTASVTTERNET
jgi:hypothetical protein